MATVDPPKPGTSLSDDTKKLVDKPAPKAVTELRQECGSLGFLKGAAPKDESVPQKMLNLPAAWRANPDLEHNKGAGIKIAVIDTGVNRNPRLDVQPGGDYVSNADGTDDCDGHGTFVAGLIAAKPSPDDSLVGVAPDAQIIAIRQVSDHFQAKDQNGDKPPGSMSKEGYGPPETLAAAVVHAVNMDADIINISETSCTAANSPTGDDDLGVAVRYAFEKGRVVVVAAGNTGTNSNCSTPNGEYSDSKTSWDNVHTVASPAWFSPYVLTVGSVNRFGDASSFTLYGPWVDVAAIGEGAVSLDSKSTTGGVIDSMLGDKGQPVPIPGTSFSTPLVSGLAALLKAKHTDWSPREIMNQIILTAHQPGTGRNDRIGAGAIDPVAALSQDFPLDVLNAENPVLPVHAGSDQPHALPTPLKPDGPPRLPRLVATVGSLVCLAALGIGLAVSIPFRRRRHDDELPDLDS
ncbi:type VII secretion-associated serine protease mycosin [Nocardia sp. NPDC059240]|uniref:type VII secretion-associated serine protease mycosin n=1 Tax=Nocardia sp. NPDC059240 TaxID=3346786 RepID=UPI0036906694